MIAGFDARFLINQSNIASIDRRDHGGPIVGDDPNFRQKSRMKDLRWSRRTVNGFILAGLSCAGTGLRVGAHAQAVTAADRIFTFRSKMYDAGETNPVPRRYLMPPKHYVTVEVVLSWVYGQATFRSDRASG